jgi:tetratricopeptide (TPR) repeat protein
VKNGLSVTRSLLAFAALTLCLAGFGGYAPAETAGQAVKAVNRAAAVRSLEHATALLASGDWDGAAFEARLGETYDPSMADFPYIEALVLAARNAPRADILERVEAALASGFFWRTYSRSEALVFSAKLKAETRRYSEALAILADAGSVASADVDYVRILSLYGLNRLTEARECVSEALDRWPFDARFVRVFLTRETTARASDASRTIASTILSRLYVWEDADRELLLLAVPFEHNPDSRVRDIRTYRSMGKNDRVMENHPAVIAEPLSAVYALEYGILTESAAEMEVFSAEKTGIRLDLLHGLCRLAGTKVVRESIANRLDGFAGIVTDDANGDGIVDSWVRYRLGRPVEAVFDANQDGYPDYSVDCDLGEPAVITVGREKTVVTYDKYPAVRTVTVGEREYTMKPLALAWAPVEWVREDFGFEGNAFYTIRLTGRDVPLTERLLAGFSAFYREGDNTRVVLENGVPVSSETRENGRVLSWTSYKRGYPALTKTDYDGDGYFETTASYSSQGALASVEADRNGNRRGEYREDYSADGTVRFRWDSDENGVYEISWIKGTDGIERTEWLHPDTLIPVVIIVENGSPRDVTYGTIRKSVIRDPIANIWWIGRLPENSRDIVKKIAETFNRESPAVVSYSVTTDGKRLNAVRTGGLLFAELVDE